MEGLRWENFLMRVKVKGSDRDLMVDLGMLRAGSPLFEVGEWMMPEDKGALNGISSALISKTKDFPRL